MDQIDKFLKRLSPKEREIVTRLIERIVSGALDGVDVKKLKDAGNIFRVRKGSIRIMFRKVSDTVNILAIERRNDHTYRDL